VDRKAADPKAAVPRVDKLERQAAACRAAMLVAKVAVKPVAARRQTAPECQAADRPERAVAYPQRAAQQAAVLRVVVKAGLRPAVVLLRAVLAAKGLAKGLELPPVPQVVAVVVR
jgi:hypothetical protein